MLILFVGSIPCRAAAPGSNAAERAFFSDSIRAVPTERTDPSGRANRTFLSRASLRSEETSAEMKFEVALKMRHFAELEARLARSEIIPRAEMEARYLPLAIDHDRVVHWLEAEGITVTRTDSNHLAVFVRASVADVARVLGTRFGRVAADGVEFTSAISPPSVPVHLAAAIRGIHGLQPQQRLRRRPESTLRPLADVAGAQPYFPAQIAQAYNSAGLGLTGAGQTIAVYALGIPRASDLTAFWAATGVAASASNIQTVKVAGGPPANTSSGSIEEATLDVQWASAMAPGAVIRIYAADENDPVGDDELIQQVLADLPTQPTLHQLTISYGADESTSDRDYIAIEAQYMASLVSAGVTVFAASGDTGALGNNGAVQIGYPASMPDVTAVGVTTLILDAGGNVASETAWGSANNSGSSGSSGGGVSTIFSRPAWQNIAGAPAGAMRLVPDVAAVADPGTGGLVIINGRQNQIGGTSMSTPIWAAWCAQINQARATAGKSPLGALNPRLYALAGTAAFRDIASGGNSLFRAGPGYDLCTGIGVPNVAALLQATMSDTFAPVIEMQSGSRFTTTGQGATFYVVATGSPKPAFHWQRLVVGTAIWNNLTDNATFAGTATDTLRIAGASLAMNGDQFRCVVSNVGGTVTGQPDLLTVSSNGVSTLAGWPGWSGFADGQGSAGRFNYTGSVRVAANGLVYVADASNHTVRKITPDGVVTTLAGVPGVAGSADGPGSVARFNGPAGVAIDVAGNVFVADAQNFTIRRISPAGIVSTVAGVAGVQGRSDGTGAAASFYDPENLALDAGGNLYIADGAGNIIRKVTPAGVVTTLAGAATSGAVDGIGSAARFNLISGIAVDALSNVYVGDFLNNAVRKITPAGVVTTLAGLAGRRNFGFIDGKGVNARFDGPTGLAVDAGGMIYVADSNNNAIRKITPDGVVTTVAGTPKIAENIDGPLAVARFSGPADVAFDAAGILYVADAFNCTVRRIVFAPPDGLPVITVAPQPQIALTGDSLILGIQVSGAGPLSYQWNQDGVPIAGATGPTYIVAAVTAASAGDYTVRVVSPAGTIVSAPALISVVASNPGALADISVRTNAGTGAQTLTVGFVLSGTAAKTLVIRGVGPSLAQFGLTGALTDPFQTLFGPNSSTIVAATNDNWNPGDASAMAAVGAFPLVAGSRDSALVIALAPGAYSAQITGAGVGGGIALAEIYDAAPGTGSRLTNISARAQVGTGADVLIAGFAISGNVPRTVLIRGVGPSLAPFGVTGLLANPRLDLFDRANVLVQGNDDWGGASALVSAFARVGAFALSGTASRDAALLVTLTPGNYTAQVSGVNDTSGVALIEIYEMSP